MPSSARSSRSIGPALRLRRVGERRPDLPHGRHDRRARPRPSRGRRAPRAASSAPSAGRTPPAAPATGCPRSRSRAAPRPPRDRARPTRAAASPPDRCPPRRRTRRRGRGSSSRSQGTAVNCSRWVLSCRQTQSRKSVGSAASSRSTLTMFGATSSSRPGLRRDRRPSGSYWPSTLPDRKPRTTPTCEPADARGPSPGSALRPVLAPASLAVSGAASTAMPSAVASTQPGRSTTSASSTGRSAPRPVVSRTASSARAGELPQVGDHRAPPRSAVTDGPVGASRCPARTAAAQSIGARPGHGCAATSRPPRAVTRRRAVDVGRAPTGARTQPQPRSAGRERVQRRPGAAARRRWRRTRTPGSGRRRPARSRPARR